MRAAVIERFGGPEVLHPAVLPDPVPAAREVRVRVGAVAVARTKDVAARAGRPPFGPVITEFPHVFGTEHAGVVDAVGPGVDVNLLGARVAVSAVLTCGECAACGLGREEVCGEFRLVGVHRQGSYAEYCVVPAYNVQPLPDEVGLAEAASLAANGGVAAAQLAAGGVGAGSRVLVLGAAGSLGSTVAALAAFRGATVFGVDRLVGEPDRLIGLPLAAAVDGSNGELPALLEAIPGGIDCVVDNLGIASLCQAYQPALAPMGTIVISGAISHDPVPLSLLPFYLRSQSLVGVRTGNRAQRDALWRDVASGFRPAPGFLHTMPLEEVALAHSAVESGIVAGQIVLEPSPEPNRGTR